MNSTKIFYIVLFVFFSINIGHPTVTLSALKSETPTKSKTATKGIKSQTTTKGIKKKQSQSNKKLIKKNLVRIYWCCRDGKVRRVSSKGQCSRKEDKLYDNKDKADDRCKPIGYCNKSNGNTDVKTINRITEKKCKQLSGSFFKTSSLAKVDLGRQLKLIKLKSQSQRVLGFCNTEEKMLPQKVNQKNVRGGIEVHFLRRVLLLTRI